MSIENQLDTVYDNVSKVYEAGKNAGEETGKEIGIELGKEIGEKSEYDRFWDSYQDCGNRTDYGDAFSGNSWTAETFKPKYDIKPKTSRAMFRYVGMDATRATLHNVKELLEKAGVILDTSGSTIMQDFCYIARHITHLPEISHESTINLYSTFYFCSGLISIDKLILRQDGTNTFSTLSYAQPFNGCNSLTRMIVEGVIGNNGFNVQWSTKLDHESLMSIINALQDKSADTSGTVWKVTIGSTNKAKLTTEELAIAYAKGWEVV